MGLALARRADSRLAAQLGFGAGRLTLLCRVMALPDPQFRTPRVLGVDDFAIRRGQTCSTVLTSVEDHRVVDFVPVSVVMAEDTTALERIINHVRRVRDELLCRATGAWTLLNRTVPSPSAMARQVLCQNLQTAAFVCRFGQQLVILRLVDVHEK
ncbi:hypothetical protein [Streptomyces sp. NPDC005795]|uniref:hypothetical protein n=1 Tax=Streptomyces sp. NPDC005795 TaxID=3154677 RepID=UPI0033FDA307